MSLGEGLSMAGGILGIGAGVTSIFGSIGQAANIKATASLNQALAEEQAGSIARRGRMERAAIRKGRAAERGKIRAAAAGAGVEESGSVLRCNLSRYHINPKSHPWHQLKTSAWTALPFGIDDPPPADLPLGILILE